MGILEHLKLKLSTPKTPCPHTMPLFRSHSREEIQIGVAWPGKRYQLDVSLELTVKGLKAKITELSSIPVEVQHLTYHGHSLKDHQKLRHYKIKHDTTVVLVRLGVDISSASGRASMQKRFSTKNTNNAYMESLSLPAESGRYDPIDSAKMANSTRAPPKPNMDGVAINNVLDNWFAKKPESSTSLVMDPPQEEPSPIAVDENADPMPNAPPLPASDAPSLASYKPKIPVAVAANPKRMDVMAALLQETPRVQQVFAPPPEALQKEEDTETIKFIVKCGKKEIKLKMNCNQDMWAVKLKLEAAKLGRAGQMTLFDEDGEELEEEATLAENDIEDGCKLLVEVS
eukprot:c20822_g1_i1.p1 GENE.c20822_g1_i1~~c20822_g1_i1.p1  ORF type:complete len:343 (+),score=73.71 c20822_g1_i1:1-1029(+)